MVPLKFAAVAEWGFLVRFLYAALVAGGLGFAISGAAPALAAPPPILLSMCSGSEYENVDGDCIPRPSGESSGATAMCEDGSYSYSTHRSGTCSGHGGVSEWL